MKSQSQRQLRVSEKLRQTLAEYLQRETFGDPILEKANLMSITEVQMSPDLKNATAYVSCLDSSLEKEMIKALNLETPRFKGEVARKAALRFTPRMHFVSDKSFDYAHKIDELIMDETVQKDINAPDRPLEDEGDADGQA